jgi:hypothetical protein
MHMGLVRSFAVVGRPAPVEANVLVMLWAFWPDHS